LKKQVTKSILTCYTCCSPKWVWKLPTIMHIQTNNTVLQNSCGNYWPSTSMEKWCNITEKLLH